MKEFKDEWICKKCEFWRRSRKGFGICTLYRANIFTEDGLRRRIRTFESDGCEQWTAKRHKRIQRVTAEVRVAEV
jgi:hypothetical protein